MDNDRTPHDQSYKMMFREPEMVASLLRDFVPEKFVDEIDFTTLERTADSFVADDCRERHDDIIWRVLWKGQWTYIYIVLEFQSGIDPWMSVRILAYTALLWQDLIRTGKIREGDPLPPVFPLVLYNGGQKWTAVQELADLQLPIAGPLAAYQPSQKYFLLEENQVSEEHLVNAGGVAAFLLRLERARNPEDMLPIVREMNERLRAPKYQRLRRIFTVWMTRVVFRRAELVGAETELTDLQEVQAMLAERATQWKHEYIQEGIIQGRAEGRREGRAEGRAEGRIEGITIGEAKGIRLALRDVLELRFGSLPPEVISAIESSTDPQALRQLTLSAFQAGSLDAFLELMKKH